MKAQLPALGHDNHEASFTLQSSRGIKLKPGLCLKASPCLVASPSPSCCPTPLPVSPRGQSLINHLHKNPHPKVGSWGTPPKRGRGHGSLHGTEPRAGTRRQEYWSAAIVVIKRSVLCKEKLRGRNLPLPLSPGWSLRERPCAGARLGTRGRDCGLCPFHLSLLDQAQGSVSSASRWGYGKGAQ